MREHDILALSRETHKMDLQKADNYTIRRLHRIANLLSEKLVLDVGCGCGLLHRILGEEIIYVGVDFVREFLTDASWLGFPSAHRIVASAHALSLRDDSFPAVVCSEVLEHLPYNLPEKCLFEAFRVLREHGSIILSTPNFAHLVNRLYFLIRGRIRRLNDMWHVQCFTVNGLDELLRIVGFRVIRRHGFDIILEPNNFLARIIFRVPYSVRKRIASLIPILDQLIILKASKESVHESSLSTPS